MEIEKDISGASEQKTDEIKNAMSDVDISNEDNPKGDGFENQVSYRGNEERGEGTEYASNEANETPEETSSSEGGQLEIGRASCRGSVEISGTQACVYLER